MVVDFLPMSNVNLEIHDSCSPDLCIDARRRVTLHESMGGMNRSKPLVRILIWWALAGVVALAVLYVVIRENLWVVKHGIR